MDWRWTSGGSTRASDGSNTPPNRRLFAHWTGKNLIGVTERRRARGRQSALDPRQNSFSSKHVDGGHAQMALAHAVAAIDWHKAAEDGNTDVISSGINQRDVGVNDRVNVYGATMLHGAAWRNRPDMLNLLLSRGADANAADIHERTALHKAARGGYPGIVTLLLAAGADADARCSLGYTPLLECAAMRSNNGIIPMRHPLTYFTTPTGPDHVSSCHLLADHSLLRHGCAELLVRAGADVNVAVDGKTPLIQALKAGKRGLVKMYLRAGSAIPRLRPETREEDAHVLVKAVTAAGGWNEFVKKHTRILACAVSKINLPHDVARAVVEFWCPPGGY